MICNGAKHPASLQVSKNQSPTKEMYSGGSLEVRNGIISIGIKNPESLQVSQNQSQTSEMNYGGSQEVKHVIISIGTADSLKSASASQVPRSRKCQ
jgi:RNA:NAD 2'-phosphotransferase (TPT1/KptA family)